MIEEDGRTVRVGGALGVRRRIPTIRRIDDLKKLADKCKDEELHDFDENGCCRMCQLCEPLESGKVAKVSKSGEAGQADSQNPLRGRNPSRRNESSDRVSGSRMKAGATSGEC